MLIPQMFVIAFVWIAAWVILILSWFAILFTGKYPEPFLNFMTWFLRWVARLTGYAMLLTDKYPPFSGREDTSYPIIFWVEPPGTLSRLTTFFRLPIAPTPQWTFNSGWKVSWLQSSVGMPMNIPHLIVLYFIGIAPAVILFISWWAVLFIDD